MRRPHAGASVAGTERDPVEGVWGEEPGRGCCTDSAFRVRSEMGRGGS